MREALFDLIANSVYASRPMSDPFSRVDTEADLWWNVQIPTNTSTHLRVVFANSTETRTFSYRLSPVLARFEGIGGKIWSPEIDEDRQVVRVSVDVPLSTYFAK